jgi:hypothetical protein
MSAKVLVLGAGRVGAALVRALGEGDSFELAVADRDETRARAAAEAVGARSLSIDARSAQSVASSASGCSVVVDASGFEGGRSTDVPEAVLRAGAHWLDLAADRRWVLGIEQLDDLAREHGVRAVSGAGIFCGLADPLVRAGTASMVRVNEVLFGLLPGPRGRWGVAAQEELLGRDGRTVRMSIGGEWTEREFFGDARRFEHPAPFGPQRSFNLDVADLELLTRKPVRSASVRLSLGLGGGLRNRVAEWCLRGGEAGALGRWRRLAPLLGQPPGAVLTILMRGVDANRMPMENRLSLIDEGRDCRLEVAAARAWVARLATDPPEPGAGAATGELDAEPLLTELERGGVSVRRGNLGGWRS